MDSSHLESVGHTKDLGITIDNHLKFHQHCSLTISKANRTLGIVSKSFEFLNEMFLIKTYTTMVRPILEYGNLIWGPHFKLDQIAIEKYNAVLLLDCYHHYNVLCIKNVCHI